MFYLSHAENKMRSVYVMEGSGVVQGLFWMTGDMGCTIMAVGRENTGSTVHLKKNPS